MSEPVPVRVGDCRCPGAPHEGDRVYLAPKLTARAGAAATYAVQNEAGVLADMLGTLAAVFMANCIVAWDFVLLDPKGKAQPVPIDRDTIDEYLPWADGGNVVANECDRLYSEDFLRPLGLGKSKSSPTGRTAPSTSATPPSSPKPRRSSKPSSQNGSDGRSFAVPVR